MAKKLSQRQLLLKLLLKGKPVTDKMAREKFGCTTITQRVPEFRKMGYKIDSVMTPHQVMDFQPSYHAVYTLDLKHAKKKGLIK